MPPLPSATQTQAAVIRQRWGLGDFAMHAPQRLRALVRADEVWLVILAAVLGLVAGLLVVAMNQVSLWAHVVLFGLNPETRLSAQVSLPVSRALLVPSLGGLAVGCLTLALGRVPRWGWRRDIRRSVRRWAPG
jgi:CIC family chloride channel protein